ncbi:hypothetical protein BC939DRAFT_33542 [Gamsiella multidivaricata]|uniref:uncharacterized protein n=1 Tax=Gamsiella multidivaricata TaxID=101098 RepID=UPI00221EE00B|nr:uncharacterized protein BC939DRAFT_33542 [Gamsiella multidivaricata]KAI7816687.1 hypothetical protein BC939DRAFT_33542 [Gamsiella multidivaricata]
METLAPRNPRTRHNSRPTPPELHLLGTPKSLPSQVSSTTSLSSINSLPSQHQHQQQQQHGQAHPRQQLPSHNHDLQSRGNTAGSSTQLQTYGAHYPSYRPYTPTTPTTPTALHALTMSMPATPTLAAMGSGFPVSPRMDHSPAFSSTSTSNSSGQSKTVVAPSTAGGLHPYTKAQRASSTRRVPSSESSLYDPYRSRQPGVSANRVKNGVKN